MLPSTGQLESVFQGLFHDSGGTRMAQRQLWCTCAKKSSRPCSRQPAVIFKYLHSSSISIRHLTRCGWGRDRVGSCSVRIEEAEYTEYGHYRSCSHSICARSHLHSRLCSVCVYDETAAALFRTWRDYTGRCISRGAGRAGGSEFRCFSLSVRGVFVETGTVPRRLSSKTTCGDDVWVVYPYERRDYNDDELVASLAHTVHINVHTHAM